MLKLEYCCVCARVFVLTCRKYEQSSLMERLLNCRL